MSKELKRQEVQDHHAIIQAIKGIGAIEELVEFEAGHGYKYAVDLEVSIYGRNYGPGKKVGPYIRMFKYPAGAEVIREGDWDTNTFYIVVEGSAEIFVKAVKEGKEPVASVKHGNPFGEMAVLAGVQRAATIKAHHETGITVLEVQRPALRMLRKLKKFGAALDLTYRNNGRNSTLGILSIGEEAKKQLAQISEFRVLARGHVACQENRPIDRLVIVKDGWLKRTCEADKTGDSADFIGSGYCIGLNALTERGAKWPYKATVLSRTEVLEVPFKKLMAYPQLMESLKTELLPFSSTGTPLQPEKQLAFAKPAKSAQDRILDKGLADATNLLVMDMDLCVRCGNCSLACHEIHGQARLTRRGIHLFRPKEVSHKLDQSILAPSVCLHCKDPECMTGCPTGAIARFQGGQVDINPATCIGCGDCATQCPYNAISLVLRKDLRKPGAPAAAKAAPAKDAKAGAKGATAEAKANVFEMLGLAFDTKPSPVTGEEDLVAVKCNLCNGTAINPVDKNGVKIHKDHRYNCVESCPTGACMRVSPTEYFSEISNIKGVAFNKNAQATVRKGSYKDTGKQIAHVIGIIFTLFLCGLTMAGIVQYGLGTPLLTTNWFNFRWITGLVGLLGIVVVMAYPMRRQMWLKRSGSLRYWMLSHTYAGVIAGVLLLLHGGTSLGGYLTASLMISFDLVILTGLFGILIYWLGPRTLTQIEGEPLLIEDLQRRREELYQEIADITATCQNKAKEQNREAEFRNGFLKGRDVVLDTITSLPYLLRQYLKKESVEELLAATQKEFQGEASKIKDQSEKDAFIKLAKAAATVRRVDALVYLHRALKLWLPPHVIFTSIMLALLLIHIIQVTYYLWRN
ncbi:MAG: cyclic nucleotide-binding domain-containing protein [Acidobacteria bacterium]|nr:cyclic nucleotide-binding domain-containing protein [Acidobacteriota bacterium]